jgi:hypothetical protein
VAVDLIPVTLTCDTSILADDDVIADTQEVTNAFNADGFALLQSLILIDEDDQKQDVDILFFNGSGTLGTENSGASISDANARNYLGKVSILIADYLDLGGVAVAQAVNCGLILKAISLATPSLYVAAVCRSGTPTYTASGLKLRLGLNKNP